MTARVVFLFASLAAFAQLPPPQAPRPRSTRDSRSPEPPTPMARVDATVSDLKGAPIAGLTAADFTVEADGKQQPIESCGYRADQPLRLAVILDDLSLSAERLDKARRALREFTATRLRSGDETAVLRTSSGAGALDRFTSDRDAIAAAISRVTYNPASEDVPPEAFIAGTLSVVRGVLEGMGEFPGRKALLLVSDRLRAPARENQALAGRITTIAHRASVVLFAVDMGSAPEQPFLLEQGLAGAVRDTGGLFVEGGDIAKALDRIAQQQAGYYVITYRPEGMSFDFLTGTHRVSRVAVKANREGAIVRARNGLLPSIDSPDDEPYADPEREFDRALGEDLVSGAVRAKLTGLVTIGNSFVVDGIVHVDGRDLTFRKSLDGYHHATVETALALYGDAGIPVKEIARTFEISLPNEAFGELQNRGIDYTITLALPQAGTYELRSLTRDSISGRAGSARQFVHATDWSKGNLVMSSIVLRGEFEKGADGVELMKDPQEIAAVRRFKAGRQITYSYSLFNVAADAEKHSSIEVRAQIFKDGAMVLNGDPMSLAFASSNDPGRRTASGTIKLRDITPPGQYILRLIVADKLAPRTATRQMDFEVRP